MSAKAQLLNEIGSVRESIEAVEGILRQWSRNAEGGRIPAELMPSIATMQRQMSSMSDHLDSMQEIVDASSEEPH